MRTAMIPRERGAGRGAAMGVKRISAFSALNSLLLRPLQPLQLRKRRGRMGRRRGMWGGVGGACPPGRARRRCCGCARPRGCGRGRGPFASCFGLRRSGWRTTTSGCWRNDRWSALTSSACFPPCVSTQQYVEKSGEERRRAEKSREEGRGNYPVCCCVCCVQCVQCVLYALCCVCCVLPYCL